MNEYQKKKPQKATFFRYYFGSASDSDVLHECGRECHFLRQEKYARRFKKNSQLYIFNLFVNFGVTNLKEKYIFATIYFFLFL